MVGHEGRTPKGVRGRSRRRSEESADEERVRAHSEPLPTAASGAARPVDLNFTSKGTGRPLVVLHGLPLDHTAMEPSLEPVFDDRPGWRRIYIDLPGHGSSPAPDWIRSNDDMARAVGDFIVALLPGQRFALAGQSYGGYLARAVTHRLAPRMLGLMLWVAARYPRDERHPAASAVFEENAAKMSELRSDMEKWLGGLLVLQDQRGVDAIKDVLAPATERSNEAFLARVTGSKLSFDPESSPFLRPSLIICGRQDRLVGYRDQLELLESYPRATVAVLDYSGHLLGLTEQNKLFRVLVGDWLDRMAKESLTPTS